MKIISFYATKGGVGKTTLAINVSAGLVQRGKKVLLCDTDEQRSSFDFFEHSVNQNGNLGFEVICGMPEKKPDADYVIVDHAPGDRVAPKAHAVVLPWQPSFLDLKAVVKQRNALNNADIFVIEVLNRVHKNRSEHKEVLKAVKNQALIVYDRSILQHLFGKGLTIYDAKLVDNLYGAKQARKDIDAIVQKLLKIE
jgi:chromosome partitioning protein